MRSRMAIAEVLLSVSFVLSLPLFGSIAIAKSPEDELAIKGYDPVAYFKVGKAVKGNELFTFCWYAMTWCFLTKENRDLFVASPDQNALQYDSYCAWAMTEARKAQTDPEEWKIVYRKLYLNCSTAAYEKWIREIPGNIIKADAIWLKLVGRK